METKLISRGQKAAATRRARATWKIEQAARLQRNAAEIASGKCPRCGQAVRRNLALTGWWQCSGFGAEGFRAAGSTPCDFQTFTEN